MTLSACRVVAAAALLPAAVLAQPVAELSLDAPACIERLKEARFAPLPAEDQKAKGPPTLALVCPELAAEIDAGAWRDALTLPSAGGLTPNAFTELVELAEYYRPAPRRSGPEPSAADLAGIVSSLEPFEDLPEVSMWDRALAWLEERLAPDHARQDDELLGWLRELEIPERWRRGIVYGAAALIVLFALAIAINELRLGGFWRVGSRARRPASRGVVEPGDGAMASGFGAVRRAPPERRPALMLALILERLRRRGAAIRPSATHRDLIAAATALGLPEPGDFDAVARAAERVTYGGWVPDAAAVEPVVTRGEAVLAVLSAEHEGAR